MTQIDTSKQIGVETPTIVIAAKSVARESLFRRLIALTFRPSIVQGFVVLADQGFRSGSTFLASLLVGRACGKEVYGFYTLLFSILVSAGAFQAGLTGTPYVALSPSKNKLEKHAYLGSVVAFHFLLSGVASFLIFGLAAMTYFCDVKVVPVELLLGFSVALVFVLFRDFIRQVLTMQAGYAYMTMGFCSAVPAFGILWFKRRNIVFHSHRFASHVKESWSIGRWLIGRASITLISGPIYCLALGVFKGPASVGLYGACMLPISFLSPIGQAINAFITPKASHAAVRNLKEVRTIVLTSVAVLGVPLISFCLLLFFFSEYVMAILFEGRYAPSSWLLLTFASQMAVLVVSASVDSGLIALKHTELGFKAQVIAAIVTIIIGLPLVYFLGIWGVGLGFLTSRLSSRLYQCVHFIRLTR